MSLFIVDVESDGPIIGKNSMVCFGVVKLTPELDKTFYGQTKPISKDYVLSALEVSGFSREEHLKFPDPFITMDEFANWLKEHSNGKPILISDNNGYDASWINYYFHVYHHGNPFGWSSRRIGDLICGAKHDLYYNWKHMRKSPHNHHPVSDAMGNAEALLTFFKEYNIKTPN